MDNRYAWLRAHRRRKIEPGDGISVITSIFDEIALYATVLGTEQAATTVRLPAPRPGRPRPRRRHARHRRHPAALAWTSSPRACATCSATAPRSAAPPPARSDIILGDGWSAAGISATDISPINPGEAFLIAEGGTPQRIKAAYLSDADIIALADYAAWTRRASSLPAAGPAIAVA